MQSIPKQFKTPSTPDQENEERDEMTLRAKKLAATKREYRRVYENMNLPPRDIVVEYDGVRYIRYAWQSLNRFGWGRWETA